MLSKNICLPNFSINFAVLTHKTDNTVGGGGLEVALDWVTYVQTSIVKLFKASYHKTADILHLRHMTHAGSDLHVSIYTRQHRRKYCSLLPHSSNFKRSVNRKLCKCGDMFNTVITRGQKKGNNAYLKKTTAYHGKSRPSYFILSTKVYV